MPINRHASNRTRSAGPEKLQLIGTTRQTKFLLKIVGNNHKKTRQEPNKTFKKTYLCHEPQKMNVYGQVYSPPQHGLSENLKKVAAGDHSWHIIISRAPGGA